MESKVGFLGGMDRDSSLSKRDPNKYYDGYNIRVLTDDNLSTGSVINEKGNKLTFKLPFNVQPVFTIEAQLNAACTVTITTSSTATTVVTTDPSINGIYNTLLANSTIASAVANKLYSITIVGNKIYAVGLSNLYAVTSTSPASTQIVNLAQDLKIIGLGTMRDWIVVFTTGTVGGGYTSTVGNGQIWKCKYNEVTEVIEGLDINGALDPEVHLVYNGVLNFSTDYKIGEVISRYQDELNGKIFFIDGLNTIKHINILGPNSLSLPLSTINVVPDIIFSQPKVTRILKGGSLKSGVIQYSYQLFNKGGAESAFAPASGVVHLTDKNDYNSNTLGYKGVAPDTNTGKSVQVSISNIDTTFDYIRLISVYYSSLEGAPEINIISEKTVPSTGYIEFIDTGNPIGVYAPVQFNATGSRIFIPETIATKNNYLVAGNIREEYFDVDEPTYWDARAYRYSGANFKADSYVGNNLTIAQEADCILTRAEQETYNTNHVTGNLGGSGININYEFIIKQLKIDTDEDDTKTFAGIDATSQAWSTKIDSTFADNNSFTSYASPINKQQLVGYTRDEIYRFGIVFFDDKGRQSFAKWIGDIKMPAMLDTDTAITYKLDGVDMHDYNTIAYQTTTDVDINGDAISPGIYANVLGINFNVNNIPVGLSYKIVRVRREQQDKYILGQGLMGVTVENGDSIVTTNPVHLTINDTTTKYNDVASYPTMVTFKSPEVLFTDSITPIQGDNIEIVAFATGTDSFINGAGGDNTDIYTNKIKSLTLPFAKDKAVIADGIKASDKWIEDNNYRYIIDNAGTRNTFLPHVLAYKGTVLALGLNDELAVISGTDLIILNYTKDPSIVQYGGNTFTDRINNVYIPCGNLSSEYVFGGDTFIGMFEYLNSMFDTGTSTLEGVTPDTLSEIVFIPLESSINVELAHGTSITKDGAIWNLCETVAMGNLLYPGDGGYDWGLYPADYTDVYQYNTAYSVEPSGKTFTVKPQFFQNNQVNDYRVIVSEKHINNQLSDSWTKFLYNNMIEVNSAYGPITKLITFRNRLFFFQDNAFGILGFEDKQLLNDNTGLPLVLGTGGILTNFQYISEKTGSRSRFGVVDTGSYLYFIDINNRKFMRFNGSNDECVSDKDNMSSFFRTFDYGSMLTSSHTITQGIQGVFDPVNKRVLYTILGDTETTFSYNEVLDNFESFYAFKPTLYCGTDFGVLSINPSDNTECYLHNKGYRGVFYGVAYDSYITHIAAPNPDYKKVFNNLEFNSYVEEAGVDVPLSTINIIQLWNSYQNTNPIAVANPNNIRRRFRTWRYQVPKVNGSRLLDYSLFIKMSFTNSISTDRYFRLDDIIAHYLIPII